MLERRGQEKSKQEWSEEESKMTSPEDEEREEEESPSPNEQPTGNTEPEEQDRDSTEPAQTPARGLDVVSVLSRYARLLSSQLVLPELAIPEFRVPDISADYLKSLEEIQKQITALSSERFQLVPKLAEIYGKPRRSKADQELIGEYESTIEELKNKLSLADVLGKIHPQAAERALEDEEFRQSFFNVESPAFVLAVDIRRSTELMLKARTPEVFAEFISTLASELRNAVIDNHGIFDKFTGDGMLAYFPGFYSGEDASLNCVAATAECHRRFATVYRTHRKCFVSVLKEIGLGIGVDFGLVRFQRVAAELVIVGTPVVYACRMAAAPAGKTFLNQPAFEEIGSRCGDSVEMSETEVQIKNEGLSVAYELQLRQQVRKPAPPPWFRSEDTEEAP
jgi:class 3 adenylate cyclase